MSGEAGIVYVIAKAPLPGACKTRLCPPLAPDQAAELARAFLLDALATIRQAGLSPAVLCRGPADQARLHFLLEASGTPVVGQRGFGLGAALESAFADGFRSGHAAVGVLAADSPTLPASILKDAFKRLRRGADLALGPCEDGGYYLLAARARHPRLFRRMPWSTSAVAAETLRRCEALRLHVHVASSWYDVDDGESLMRLRRELALRPDGTAAHTRAVLESPAPYQLAAAG